MSANVHRIAVCLTPYGLPSLNKYAIDGIEGRSSKQQGKGNRVCFVFVILISGSSGLFLHLDFWRTSNMRKGSDFNIVPMEVRERKTKSRLSDDRHISSVITTSHAPTKTAMTQQSTYRPPSVP